MPAPWAFGRVCRGSEVRSSGKSAAVCHRRSPLARNEWVEVVVEAVGVDVDGVGAGGGVGPVELGTGKPPKRLG